MDLEHTQTSVVIHVDGQLVNDVSQSILQDGVFSSFS